MEKIVNLSSIAPGSLTKVQVGDEHEEYLEIIPLGAGCEVGRSCLYMECKGRKIMLDCGLHPAREGI
jgi:cleavage and polyadenylation specificity factor subunit 3